MKKKVIILLGLLLTMCLSGCSHKTNAEIVDVEQFRCQDSIDTVFEVLGETEIKEYSIPSYLDNRDMAYYERGYYIIFADIEEPKYYIYENVNLFGFKGYVVFDVREDEETIQGIYCTLRLADKEFEELVGYFSDKYDSYEVGDFGESIKTYKWTISEKDGQIGYEADELGFDEIVIENRGDDKYIIALNDEWSFTNDETYFNKVEQAKEAENTQRTLIAQGKYDVCGDTVNLFVSMKEGIYEFRCYATAQNKSNANVLATFLYAACEGMKESFGGYSIIVSYEDKGRVDIEWDGESHSITGVNEDGTKSSSIPDWYNGESSMSESEQLLYVMELEEAFDQLAVEINKYSKR